ncbi:hypothetical protein T03_6752 [Trichinella britovi]|uniref:KRAB-A domain-containing protein 2 n=1 Tax=Trichinella britovi TaxID=45882 RepID=A0A0V1B7G0_TRIBR|nr:hypothetical protein T03_6752 [Trichinella britovi]
MTRRSKKMLIPLQIGQNCTLRVPDVDRRLADPKNFLAVVMAECEGLYTVGCREKKLSSKFTTADLQLRATNYMLSVCVNPAAHRRSGRCSCSRKKVSCNSRRHTGKSCKNI